MALTTSRTPLKLFSSWKTCKISMIRETTATRSSRFSVSTMHLQRDGSLSGHRLEDSKALFALQGPAWPIPAPFDPVLLVL